jgi:transposase
LGNPTQFYLTPGQAHDLQGADALLPRVEADFFLADKAYDAQERVIDKLQAKNCQIVIPSKSSRIQPREYDQHLYKARHLVENFFAKLKQYRAIGQSPRFAIATRYDKTAVNFLGSIYLASSVVWLN